VPVFDNHGLGSSRQAISQHLEVLEAAGLIETRREGRYKFHYINTRPLEPAADGIPFTQFGVDDVEAEYERLRGLGVRFTQEPADMGPVTTAVLDDTCGNLIQIAQQVS